MFLGLRTVIYPTASLAESREFWTSVLGVEPYFDESFYVGYNAGGYELGLDPHGDVSRGPITYWGVADIAKAVHKLINAGARLHDPIDEVGGDIHTATLFSPAGEHFGVIQNPHFALPDSPPDVSEGPGR